MELLGWKRSKGFGILLGWKGSEELGMGNMCEMGVRDLAWGCGWVRRVDGRSRYKGLVL